jgi:hypothetical protein
MANNCSHYHERQFWIAEDEEDGDCRVGGYWHYTSESACVDISIGAYKCTICKEVMYYTGKWKNYYENNGSID